MNAATRSARRVPEAVRSIAFIQRIAVGATDGNIIATIMTTQTTRNDEIGGTPIIIGIMAVCCAVTAHARSAIARNAIHAYPLRRRPVRSN
jgi:hypothetical protein